MEIELNLLQDQADTKLISPTRQRFTFRGDYDEVFDVQVTYLNSGLRQLLTYWTLNVLSLGIVYLMVRWFLHFRLWLCYRVCNLDDMTHVFVVKLINGVEDTSLITDVAKKELHLGTTIRTTVPLLRLSKVFTFELIQFYFDANIIKPLRNNLSTLTHQEIIKSTHQAPRETLKSTYGENKMDLPVQSIGSLLIEEVLSPFNVFQVFALALWAYDDYAMYACLIGVITLTQIVYELRELKRNQQRIRDMILLETTVIMADGTLSHSAELVPGDRIRITNGKVPCDCILLHGQVIMNEALLTGESVPVIKEALASSTNLFDPQQCEKNLIFNGTSCLQSLDGEALVYQTGFLTMKGSLSRSILFSKNKSFSFKEDSAKYLLVMLTFGLLSLVGNIYITIHQGYSLKKAIIRGLEVITICVPPSLPAALGAGIQLAINRLDAQGISCIKPDKVNVGGIVNLCAFDKTGTLTESGLEIYGCKPSKDSGFGKRLRVDELSSQQQLYRCLGCCHSLSMIDEQLMGDPLDLKMFGATGLSVLGSRIIGKDLTMNIVKRFDFLSELQRMSVIAQVDGKLALYVKGSPEMVSKLCVKVPDSFDYVLKMYALQGLRIIACAYREVDNIESSRAELENDLIFQGFLIFENQLKPESNQAIQELKASKFVNVMVTGDNELTAINVAKKCSIVESKVYICKVVGGTYDKLQALEFVPLESVDEIEDDRFDTESVYSTKGHQQWTNAVNCEHILEQQPPVELVINGTAFEFLMRIHPMFVECQDSINRLLQRTRILARMKPKQKGDYVRHMRSIAGTAVAFCGDGTNDTCALKNGDLGLALSEEDASLAAPFTSHVFNVSAMVKLIKECRASLVTCVECFKFMTLYSIIQASAVITLYFVKGDFTNNQYLYQDLWLILPLAFTMDLSGASKELATYRPISHLISFPILLSVLGHIGITILTQTMTVVLLIQQSWYLPYDMLHKDVVNIETSLGYENSVLIIIANSQVLAMALAFARGAPFRQDIHTNKAFVYVLIVGTIGHLLVILYPQFWLVQYLGLCYTMPLEFRIVLLWISIGIVVQAVVFERTLVEKYIRQMSQ